MKQNININEKKTYAIIVSETKEIIETFRLKNTANQAIEYYKKLKLKPLEIIQIKQKNNLYLQPLNFPSKPKKVTTKENNKESVTTKIKRKDLNSNYSNRIL